MLPRLVAALIVLALATPAYAAKTAETNDAQIHFLAIGDLPLDGGFVSGKGVRSKVLFDEGHKSEWERELRSAWRIDAFPSAFEGVTWKGEPVTVRLAGVEPNEFGKLWKVDQPPPSADVAGPLIYWSGSLALTVLPPAKRALESPDEHVIRAQCIKTGHEMKQFVRVFEDAEGNARANYYLDPLHDEDRADIANPDVAEHVRIDTVSPTGVTAIGLAGCWYASASKTDTWYRGPVFAYDFHARRIVWSDALDLDEHVNFLEYAGDIYLVEYYYCDQCETGGWTVGRFANRVPSDQSLSDPTVPSFRIVGRHVEAVSGTASWFDGE